MFLSRIKAKVTVANRNQRGSVLIAVVGVMAAGLLVALLIASVLASAFSFSSSTKADVQSQAAAEGGLAVALAGLSTSGNCELAGGVYQSSGTPTYLATVWRSVDGVTYTLGCPVSTTTRVRIIATGTAAAPGILGATANNQKYVEAVYSYGASGSGGSSPGLAMYSYSAGQLDTYQILSPGGQGGHVGIRTGNFACTGPTIVDGNVQVAAGSAALTNDCSVRYSLTATGTIALTSRSAIWGDATSSGGGVSVGNSTSWVGGNIYANGSVTTNGGVSGSIEAVGAVTLVQGSNVSGSIRAGSTVAIQAYLGGDVTTPGNLSMVSPGRVVGNIRIGGTLSYNGLTNAAAATALKAANMVGGTILYGQSGISTPTPKPSPVVADWVDVRYTYSDWQANGFQSEITWPSALGCRLGDYSSTNPSGVLYPFYQQLKNLSQPTVVDARDCSSVAGRITLALHTDVAFIADDFNLDQLLISSADANTHRIWFISPDAQPTQAGPQCSKKGGDFAINTTSTISDGVVAMAYAPCSIAINNGTIWRGQLYSGDMNGGGGVRQLYYLPIGIPGSLIGGGTAPPSGYQVGALISLRNRSDNGQ